MVSDWTATVYRPHLHSPLPPDISRSSTCGGGECIVKSIGLPPNPHTFVYLFSSLLVIIRRYTGFPQPHRHRQCQVPFSMLGFQRLPRLAPPYQGTPLLFHHLPVTTSTMGHFGPMPSTFGESPVFQNRPVHTRELTEKTMKQKFLYVHAWSAKQEPTHVLYLPK